MNTKRISFPAKTVNSISSHIDNRHDITIAVSLTPIHVATLMVELIKSGAMSEEVADLLTTAVFNAQPDDLT